ncbi:transcription factor VBP-like [Spodoptera frugiperda]|uniref:Transcription factor VBP-like n=1 Tax=Spodoptera frugiperda TaxID=7108 RepID=A0A9R0D2U3_SPOFR|nr:transcription factor VBP-like [Spodoptera frugiperda]
MSLWRPYLLDEIKTTEVPMDLTVTQVPQSVPVPVSTTYSTFPTYPLYPGYVPLPMLEAAANRSVFLVSPSGSMSSGYQSSSAPSPSPLPAPPAAVSAPKSSTAEIKDDLADDPDFQRYAEAAMSAMAARNGGALIGNNPHMRRTVRSQAHTGAAAEDDAYRRNREKNNAAAKQSRDRRKLREIQLSLQVSYLKRRLAALQRSAGARACSRCHHALC